MNNSNLEAISHKSLAHINPLLKIGWQFFSAAAIASMIWTPFIARANTRDISNLNLSDFDKPAIIQVENNLPQPNFEMIKYEIKEGDTLWILAKKFGVKMVKIMELNPEIKDKDHIIAWDIIQIPCRYKLLSKKFPKAKVKAQKNIREITKVPEELKKEIISVDSNIKSLITYLWIYKKWALAKIQSSSLSVEDVKWAILDLFLEDSKTYKEKLVVQEIHEIKFDDWIEKNISKILSNGWYEWATVYNLLSTVTKVETSWWNFYDSVKAAQNTTDDERKNYYIKQAVKRSLGGSNDCWPFQITPGWLKSEIKESWVQFSWKINENTDLLREKLTKTFSQAVEKWLTQEQTKKALINTDCRFDTEKMAKFVLSNFIRNYKQIDSKAKDLSCSNKTKLTLMAYNVGIGWALNRCRALLNWAKSAEVYNTADIKLRHHILQVSSIENKISRNKNAPDIHEEQLEENTSTDNEIKTVSTGTIEFSNPMNSSTVKLQNSVWDNILQLVQFKKWVSRMKLVADVPMTTDSVIWNNVVDSEASIINVNSNVIFVKTQVRTLLDAQIALLTENVLDPELKKEIIWKLWDNPIQTMEKNIKLQREKWELWDLQAQKNAVWLQDLLDKCLTELVIETSVNDRIAA